MLLLNQVVDKTGGKNEVNIIPANEEKITILFQMKNNLKREYSQDRPPKLNLTTVILSNPERPLLEFFFH